MSKLIISAISTLTAMPTSKPLFGVTPNPNMMPTSQEKAPVLLSIKADETIDAEKFAELFAAECKHFDAVEAFRRINGIGEVLAKCAAECKNVQLGFANLEVNVTGTIPDTNAALNDANKAEYIAIESAAVRKTIAGIETRIPTSVTPADVKRVRDVATGDNKIHGEDPFFIQGLELTTGGEGEKIELFTEDMSAKVADVEVIDGTSDISLKTKLASLVEPGRYYLLVTTLAGGEMTLYPVGISVTVIEDDKPHIVSLTGKIGGEGKMKSLFDELTVKTKNVPASAQARLALYSPSGELMTDTAFGDTAHVTYTMDEDGVITFKLKTNDTAHPDGAWTDYDNITKFELKVGDTILAFPIKFVK